MLNIVMREDFQQHVSAISAALQGMEEYLDNLVAESEEVGADITEGEIRYLQGHVDAAHALITGLSGSMFAADLALLQQLVASGEDSIDAIIADEDEDDEDDE